MSYAPRLQDDAPEPQGYRPFPVHSLPFALADFVGQASATLGVDPATVAAPLLSVVAGAIGNSRWIEVKALFRQPPNLWTAVVLPSGSLKTPALQTVRRWADLRDDEAFRDFRKDQAEHEDARADRQKGDPPLVKPKRRQFVVQDCTCEAMVTILANNPRGVVVVVDELRQWFAAQGRYGGGDSRMTEMAAWNQIFDGARITQDRVSGDCRRVKHASASVTGMIQPAMFRDALTEESFASGQAARFLACQPPTTAWTWTDATISDEDFAPLDSMFNALYGLAPGEDEYGDIEPGLLGVEPDAIEVFRGFVEPLAQRAIEPMIPASHAAALAKMRGITARLALIFQLARWASGEPAGPHMVDAASMEMAVVVADWWGEETLRVYDLFASNPADEETAKLASWIESRGGMATPRQVVAGVRAFRQLGVAGAEAAMERVAKAGLGVWGYAPGGRKRVLYVGGDNMSAVNTWPPHGASNTESVDSAIQNGAVA